MTPEPIEPLSEELQALLAREAAGYPDDPALAREVLGGVQRAVLLSGAMSAPLAALRPVRQGASLSVAKIAALTFVAGALVGAAVVQAVHMRSLARPAPAPAATVRVESPKPVVTPLAPTTPAHANEPPREHGKALPSARPAARVSRPESELGREQHELAVARSALLRGRYDDALLAAQNHARLFPHGQLEEERELLVIQALVMAQRMDEAREHAAAFRRRFPRSVLLPALEAALHSDVP